MTDFSTLPRFPRVEARTHPDGSGELTINGTSHPIATADAAEARAEMTRRVADLATKIGRPIRVSTQEPEGSWPIVVHPDGAVEPDTDAPAPAAPSRRGRPAAQPAASERPGRRRTRAADSAAGAALSAEEPEVEHQVVSTAPEVRPAAEQPPSGVEADPVSTVPEPDPADEQTRPATALPAPAPEAPAARDPHGGPALADAPAPVLPSWQPTVTRAPAAEAHVSLPTVNDLLRGRPEADPGPAELGWRGQTNRLSLGLVRLRPGPAEAAHRDALAEVRRSLSGPKTVVVVNPKGGAHKTTTTLLLAATFGQHRGGYTLAWDNNETRGTLGWRAQPAGHARTATDLLADLDRFATATRGRVGDLDYYVRPQTAAHFDVLASDEDAAAAATIDADAFARLHATLTRFYRVLVVDTGNNMRAPNWGAAIDAADQLVIVSTVREDTAATAAWLVDGLRARGQDAKVAQAVTLLAAPDSRPAEQGLRARLHDHFGQLTRTVLDVPYDPALASGAPIDADRLHPRTREAWLQAAAAVASGL